LTLFLEELAGRNVSPATVTTYEGSLTQWFRFLEENDGTIEGPTDLKRSSISEYLAHLSSRGLSGMYRARVLSAIRAYCTFLVTNELIDRSPTVGILTPKKEQNSKAYLRTDEYTRLLAQAGSN